MLIFHFFLKLQNKIIKKSLILINFTYLALQLKLESRQPQFILGLGEYTNLNDLATDIGIYITLYYLKVAFPFCFQNTNNMPFLQYVGFL